MYLNRTARLSLGALAVVLIAIPLLAGREDDAERASKNGKTERRISPGISRR